MQFRRADDPAPAARCQKGQPSSRIAACPGRRDEAAYRRVPQPGAGETRARARAWRVLTRCVAQERRLEGLATKISNSRWGLDLRHQDAIDFRGPDAKRGSKGQYADVQIHAGLICLDAASGMDLDMQLRLFKEALTEVGDGDLINQVLEVYLTEEGDRSEE